MSEVNPQALRDFRDAVHDMYRASIGIDRTSATDAAYRLRDVPDVNRLFLLHAVASSVNRAPDLVLGDEDETTPVVNAFADVTETGNPVFDTSNRGRRVQGIRDFAALARSNAPLTPERWRTFLVITGEPGTGPDEPGPEHEAAAEAKAANDPAVVIGKPGCNDEPVLEVPSGAASVIRSRFWVNRALGDAGAFINPKNWPVYGRPFWKQMAVVEGTKNPGATDDRYSAVFEEIVDLPLVGEVTVYLTVDYTRTDEHVIAKYRLAEGYDSPQVTFDSGWLYATGSDDPAVGGTYIEGLKAIRFDPDSWNQYTDLMCDGGWVHFMINMALGGDGLPISGDTPRETVQYLGPPPQVEQVVGELDGIVDGWVKSATASLQGHGTATKTALHRILAPDYDPRWVNDVIGMGHGAVSTTKSTLAAWRKALQELSKLGGMP